MSYGHDFDLLIDHENLSETDLINRAEQVNKELIDSYIRNVGVEQPASGILIGLYAILIILGGLGNTLVILSVVRKPAMRTPRNMFIVNLAISDLLLCTITMPLTLMEILTKYFPLGNDAFMCKVIGMLQATSIFVSTISITAIALDRYQVIIYPTGESLQLAGAIVILLVIWVIAITLASPLYIFRMVEHHEVTFNDTCIHLNFCFESWPSSIGRYHYTIFSFIFQYSLPIIIVSAAYVRILYKLRYRFAAGFVAQNDSSGSNRRQLRGRRLQRTNMLLVSIAVIFFMSWLPLNLFNLVADIFSKQEQEHYDFTSQNMRILYAVCHMVGMSSACSNPVLYGWLNENFWKEFQDIMCIGRGKKDGTGEVKKSSLRRSLNDKNTRGPDLVGDFHPGTSVNTEMSLLSKC